MHPTFEATLFMAGKSKIKKQHQNQTAHTQYLICSACGTFVSTFVRSCLLAVWLPSNSLTDAVIPTFIFQVTLLNSHKYVEGDRK